MTGAIAAGPASVAQLWGVRMEPSGGEIAGIFGGVVGLLGLVGGAIAWLFRRKDDDEDRADREEAGRAAKLSAWHNELIAREQLLQASQSSFQARLEERVAEQDLAIAGQTRRIVGLEGQVENYRIANAALMARVSHYDPNDPVLKMTATLVGLKEPMTPADFDGAHDDLLRKIK